MYLKDREDAQTWRDRLTGKRIVSGNRHITEHDSWKSADIKLWEPRVYFCTPIGEGLDRALTYSVQTASPLLMLPAEIRNYIIGEVVPPHAISQQLETGGASYGDATWKNTSAVIFCCKQLYSEGRALAVAMHTVRWESLPRSTRLCAAGREKSQYDWRRLNVVCDTRTNVIKHAFYG